MQTVEGVLLLKGDHEVHTIPPDSTVFEAIKILAEENLGALPVTEKGKVIGIVSERDYTRKVILKGRSSRDTLTREIMTHHVIYVTSEQTVEACMHLMINKYIRHLPVLKDGDLIGIISIGDVVKSVISEKEFVISELESYISGTPM